MLRDSFERFGRGWVENVVRSMRGRLGRRRRPGRYALPFVLEARCLISGTAGAASDGDEATVPERYQAGGQSYSLVPRTGEWAISVDTGTVDEFFRANPQFSDWKEVRTLDSKTAIVSPASGRGTTSEWDGDLENLAWSSPVYGTAAGGWLVPTNEAVVSLRPGEDPAGFFADAARFSGYRALAGSGEEFIATVADGAGAACLQLANELASDPRVKWAAPNFFQDILPSSLANDPEVYRQWHLENEGIAGGQVDADVDAEAAWLQSQGNRSIIISVVDDGMELSHPDLAPNLFSNPGEIAGNGIDDDNNGYIDDRCGWDYTTNGPLGDNNPEADSREDSHATSVAGIAVGRGNNGVGISGIAPDASGLPVRIFGAKDTATTSANIASAIYYAAGRTRDGQRQWANVPIMNISWGGGSPDAAITAAFTWASQSARGGLGTAVFIAAGNNAAGALSYPASLAESLTGVIAVGASTNLDARASYSNYGTGLSLVAPSGGGTAGVVTTDRLGSEGSNWSGAQLGVGSNDYTDSFSGTSAATPLAAGIGALVLSRAEDLGVSLTSADVRGLLMNTTDLVGPAAAVYDDRTGWSSEYGSGRVNAARAVSGVGQREVGVFMGRTSVPSGGSVELGSVPLGTVLRREIRIRNEGTSPLSLSGLSLTGGAAYSLAAGFEQQILAVGESTTFTVAFNPTTTAAQAGSVQFTTNDADEATYAIQLIGTGQELPGDQYESYDSPTKARSISTDGVPLVRSLHSASDVDWMRFRLTARSHVTIQTDGGPGIDTVLELFERGDPTTPIDENDNYGADGDSRIERSGAKTLLPGAYLTRVTAGPNSALGSYTFSVTASPVDVYENDDQPSNARSINPGGVVQTRSLHVATDADWATFTVFVDSHVTILTDGNEGGDTKLRLYGPDDSTLLLGTVDDDGVSRTSQIVRTGSRALLPGTYYVEVTSGGQRTAVSEYNLSVLATDVYEKDNGRKKATFIRPNGKAQLHSFHTGRDVDWVRFAVYTTSSVIIETNGVKGGDTVLELFKGDSRSPLASDDNGGVGRYSRLKRTLKPGVYYARLTESGRNNRLERYSVRVWFA